MASSDQECFDIVDENIELDETAETGEGGEAEYTEQPDEEQFTSEAFEEQLVSEGYEEQLASEEYEEQLASEALEQEENGGDEVPEETDESEQKETSTRKRSRSSAEKSVEPEKDDFEDDELDSVIDETENSEEVIEDAEAEEEERLSMPAQRAVTSDVGHLMQERRVTAHPLTFAELDHPIVQSTVAKDSCEEVKLHFVRPKDRPEEWSGFLVMDFTSSLAAKQAVEDLKTVREDLTIKSEDAVAYLRTAENWAKEEKGRKHWTDTLLFIKNIGENVTEDQLKEIFTDAEDIVISKREERSRSSDKKDEKKTKVGYAVFRTGEVAQRAANEYGSQVIELDDLKLKVYKYHTPTDVLPRGLLRLRERRVVLKYLEKLLEKIECATEEEKVPEWCTKRQNKCTEIIELDDDYRQSLGLLTPSLDELREMRSVKVLQGADRKRLLERLGVIEVRRRSYHRSSRDSRDRGDYHRGYDRKRSYSSYRPSDSRQSSRSILGCPPPSLINMPQSAVPLSLLMQQSNLALMSGYMNQRNLQMMGMVDDSRGSYRDGRSEPSNKMLRLDATGNFSVDDHGRDRRRRDSGDRYDRPRSSKGSSYRSDRR